MGPNVRASARTSLAMLATDRKPPPRDSAEQSAVPLSQENQLCEVSMRVLHVVRQFHPSIGGLESVVAGLAGEQRRNGIAAEVLTLDRLFHDPTRRRLPATDQVGDIPIRRIPFAGSRRYPLAAPVLRHLRGFDLVHVHGVDFFSDFLAATQPLHKRPLVLSTHGGFFHTSFARR